MEIQNCGNCKNFILHYIRQSRGSYYALRAGHCIEPRIKNRCIDDKACPHWKGRN